MLIINAEQKEQILKHAQLDPKAEVCGILAGNDGMVKKVFCMRNTSETPELCYFMDAAEQFKVMKELRSLGMTMLAIYHSHVGSEAFPSAKDIELAFYPGTFYVIISLEDKSNPVVRAFQIVEGKINEEKIKIV